MSKRMVILISNIVELDRVNLMPLSPMHWMERWGSSSLGHMQCQIEIAHDILSYLSCIKEENKSTRQGKIRELSLSVSLSTIILGFCLLL